MVLKHLLLAVAFAKEYPEVLPEFEFESSPPTYGFSQVGTITVVIEAKAVDPTFKVQLETKMNPANPLMTNGFYQSYFQLLNTKISGNSGYEYWENFVCSLRYTANSANSVTSIDYFFDNSCGLGNLSDIKEGNYRAVTAVNDNVCADPWYKDYGASSFGASTYTCGFYRDFTWQGSHLLAIGQTVTFRTGFNIFSDSQDTTPNMQGSSPNLEFTILQDAAVRLAAGLAVCAFSVLI